jgi:hypothetical protein
MLAPVSELMLWKWMCDCQESIDGLWPVASRISLRAYSIPDEVTAFFDWPNPSSLTEMSTRNLPGGKGWPEHNADNLTSICEPIVYKMWEPWRLTILWASMACYRDGFTGIETIYFNKNVEFIGNIVSR